MTTLQTASDARLPAPQDHPGRDVVIFDGHCKFCTAQVRKLAKWDTKARLTFLSLHDPEVASRYPDISYDDLMNQVYVVDTRGKRHGGAAAFRYLTTRLPRLYWLAPLMHLPFLMPLWHWGYRQVAKRRYAFAGRMSDTCEDGTCHVHFK